MLVIEHGKTHRVTTCPVCNCKFEFDKKDIVIEPQGPRWNRICLKYFVKCPECFERIELKER